MKPTSSNSVAFHGVLALYTSIYGIEPGNHNGLA